LSYLIVENLTKAYAEKTLFEDVDFTIEPGEKIALVAPNGAGKTTLFRMLLGFDDMYEGSIEIDANISLGYLSQDIHLDDKKDIWSYLMASKSKKMEVFIKYKNELNKEGKTSEKMKHQMDIHSLWNYEDKIEGMISKFKLDTVEINHMSSGQKKRLMIIRMILDEPDLLFLDEPTNHLDHDMLEFLEGYLKRSNQSVFVVSHDRFFLDRIANEVMEIDRHKIFTYKGDYTSFVKKKKERIDRENSEISKARSLPRSKS